MNTIIRIIASFLSGLIGSMGFGGGGILIIYLTIFSSIPQIKAQGINLAFFIPCSIISTIIYTAKHQIKYKEIYPVILGGILGAFLGGFIIKIIKSKYLTYTFAIFLITMGVNTFITREKKCDEK